jgi:hypothetical protein
LVVFEVSFSDLENLVKMAWSLDVLIVCVKRKRACGKERVFYRQKLTGIEAMIHDRFL